MASLREPGPGEDLVFELFMTPDGRADPFPRYHGLREMDPVHWSALGFWLVTGYADCAQLLRNPTLARDFVTMRSLTGNDPALLERPCYANQAQWMVYRNPPDHTRLRGLVSRAFTPTFVAKLRPQMVAIVEELLDAAASNGGMEVIADFAYPLPLLVIAGMLGAPVADRHLFRQWAMAIAATLEPIVPPDVATRADEAMVAAQEYFRELIADKRRHPDDRLLSALIAAEDDEGRLSEVELMGTTITLFTAGFETTTNLIGNGLLALLRHRDQWSLLVTDPSLAPVAVEELLRFDGPVHIATPRVPLSDIDVGGVTVQAGEFVQAVVGAANRDPARYDEPDRLDITRQDVHPLTFGGGVHVCLGASLARLEAAVAFEALARRCPAIRLAGGEPAWRERLTIRGVSELPVVW